MSLKCILALKNYIKIGRTVHLSLNNYIRIFFTLQKFVDIETYECATEYMKKVNVKEYKKNFLEVCRSAKKMTPEKRLKDLFALAGIKRMKLLIKLLIDKNIIEENDLRDFINKNFAYFISDEMLNDEKAIDAMNLVFEEVHNKRGVDFSDIKFLNYGFYKKAYILETENDKVVIKMGAPREIETIPYTSEALYPVFHRKIIPGFEIEITEFAKDVYMTEEEAYQFYKKERDKGIIMTDISLVYDKDRDKYICENLGRLTKPNCIHYLDKETGEPIYVDPRSVGFEYNNKLDKIEILGKGETVIRDLDYIFKEGKDKPEWLGCFVASERFEERYQKEKKQEERKKLIKNLKEKEKLLKKFTKIKKATFNWRQEYGNRKSATTGYGSRTSGDWEHVN